MSASLPGANRAATNLIQLGTSIPITIEGETRGRQLCLIDWATPANNVFHMTADWHATATRSAGRNRTSSAMHGSKRWIWRKSG